MNDLESEVQFLPLVGTFYLQTVCSYHKGIFLAYPSLKSIKKWSRISYTVLLKQPSWSQKWMGVQEMHLVDRLPGPSPRIPGCADGWAVSGGGSQRVCGWMAPPAGPAPTGLSSLPA